MSELSPGLDPKQDQFQRRLEGLYGSVKLRPRYPEVTVSVAPGVSG